MCLACSSRTRPSNFLCVSPSHSPLSYTRECMCVFSFWRLRHLTLQYNSSAFHFLTAPKALTEGHSEAAYHVARHPMEAEPDTRKEVGAAPPSPVGVPPPGEGEGKGAASLGTSQGEEAIRAGGGVGVGVAAEEPPARLIEKLYPYILPLFVLWFTNMFQWSEDPPRAAEASAASAAASPSATGLAAQSAAGGDAMRAAEESSFLSRLGVFGDMAVIVAVALVAVAWRASQRVETQAA